MNGLPDIEDPFDVSAFRSQTVPDDENAFVLYRQAKAKFKELAGYHRLRHPLPAWSKAAPELRDWVIENRETLELFQLATERPKALAHSVGCRYSASEPWVGPSRFCTLAYFEASRLEEQGDMEKAWGWYRAILRCTAHYAQCVDAVFQIETCAIHRNLERRINAWAADPNTTTSELRSALRDVLECEPKPEWDVYLLKEAYLDAIGRIDDPNDTIHQGDPERRRVRIADMEFPTLEHPANAARLFITRDVERSRRILRLAFANWLAWAASPASERPRPTVCATFRAWESNGRLLFYPMAPGSGHHAGAIPPRKLAEWFLSSGEAKGLFVDWPWQSICAMRSEGHRNLVIGLATKLFERDRGYSPPSEDALVGTYLDKLPEESNPRIEGSATTLVE